MSATRIVITGMGWVTPLGHDIEKVWKRLVNGDSGVDVTDFNLWNGRKFQAVAPSAVPEPTPWVLLIVVTLWHLLSPMGIRFADAPVARTRQAAIDAMNRVGLGDRLDHEPNQLSGGQQQRVALARALVKRAEILLLDEPTNGMDPKGIIEIREMIHDLSEQGKTLIVSSHLLSEIEKSAHEVMILKSGQSVFYGSIENLKGHRDLESFYLSYA